MKKLINIIMLIFLIIAIISCSSTTDSGDEVEKIKENYKMIQTEIEHKQEHISTPRSEYVYNGYMKYLKMYDLSLTINEYNDTKLKLKKNESEYPDYLYLKIDKKETIYIPNFEISNLKLFDKERIFIKDETIENEVDFFNTDIFFPNNNMYSKYYKTNKKIELSKIKPIYDKMIELNSLNKYSREYWIRDDNYMYDGTGYFYIEKDNFRETYYKRLKDEIIKNGLDKEIYQKYNKNYQAVLDSFWNGGIVVKEFGKSYEDEKIAELYPKERSSVVYGLKNSKNPYNYDKNTIYRASFNIFQFFDENSALIESNYGLLFYMNEPNLARKIDEINKGYLVYDGVYEYITTSGSKNIVPKFKPFNFPPIPNEIIEQYKKEVDERNRKIKEIEAKVKEEFELEFKNIAQQQEKLLAEINEMIKNYNETGSVEGTNNK